jgi:hypothetical protein
MLSKSCLAIVLSKSRVAPELDMFCDRQGKNALFAQHVTVDDDAFSFDWLDLPPFWMNPPYVESTVMRILERISGMARVQCILLLPVWLSRKNPRIRPLIRKYFSQIHCFKRGSPDLFSRPSPSTRSRRSFRSVWDVYAYERVHGPH